MKRWIHAKETISRPVIDLRDIDLQCVIVVPDARTARPEESYVYASKKHKERLPYYALTKEQLKKLPRREFENITDVAALRKLEYDDLTVNQKRIVYQSNSKEEIKTPEVEVNAFLDKVRNEPKIFVEYSQKNRDFASEILRLGGKFNDDVASDMISKLSYSNFRYSKYSYLAKRWNAILMVFKYKGSYTFEPAKQGEEPVTISDLDVYIKIDVEHETNKGFCAVSFHKSGLHDDEEV